MMFNIMAEINNVPEYAKLAINPYWVVRLCDSALWFYGAYETIEQASRATNELNNGFIVEARW